MEKLDSVPQSVSRPIWPHIQATFFTLSLAIKKLIVGFLLIQCLCLPVIYSEFVQGLLFFEFPKIQHLNTSCVIGYTTSTLYSRSVSCSIYLETLYLKTDGKLFNQPCWKFCQVQYYLIPFLMGEMLLLGDKLAE